MSATEPAARTVEATINYVARGSCINRRFVASALVEFEVSAVSAPFSLYCVVQRSELLSIA